MRKQKNRKTYDENLITALKKLQSPIYDKKHDLYVYVRNDMARSNESRFEHIAKNMHELKVRDIESIPEGINKYVKYSKSKELKDTYYYYIDRKGEDKGFLQIAIKLIEEEKNKYYVKAIFITYRIK